MPTIPLGKARVPLQPLLLWLMLRGMTSLVAAFVSTLRPLTELEKTVPLFPPSSPLGDWITRALLSPWLRWDAEWYQRIVVQGYHPTDGTAQFHPLYPWLATTLANVGIHPLLCLLIVSGISGIALFYVLEHCANLDLSPNESRLAMISFAFAPPAFVLFAPYSEATFLLFAVLCIFWARKHAWWLAGLAGGLATLTRQQGIFLLLPLAWELWETSGRNVRLLIRKWKDLAALLCIPLGMGIWLIYRLVALTDLQADFTNIQSVIYSLLISQSAEQVVPVQRFLWPWEAIILALNKLFAEPDVDIWVNIVTSGLFLIMLNLSWKNLRISERLYTLAITLVSFSYYTGPIHPYMGLPRHLFLAFPVFIGIRPWLKKKWLNMAFICLSLLGMFFLLGLYVLEGWVP